MATVTLEEALHIIWKRYSGLYAYIEQQTGINNSTFRNAYEGKSKPELPTINKIIEEAMKIVEEDANKKVSVVENGEHEDLADKKFHKCDNCKKSPTQDPLSYCYKCRFASAHKAAKDEVKIKDEVIEKNKTLSREMFTKMEETERFKGIVDDVQQELVEMLTMIRKRSNYDVS